MRVAIVDFGSGNLRSAARALERAARDAALACAVDVTADAAAVAAADRIVLPGDGAFADCRRGLEALPGMVEALALAVQRRGVPFLGICVGMQLLATRGTEHGVTPGLDWIAGECVRLAPADPLLKVPHMGWNELLPRRAHPLLDGIDAGAHAYFVHSFHVVARAPADVVATTSHGGDVTAVVARANIAGTQFHPEKSQATGLRILANFLRWRP
ncbi:MAG: imidazole glycerol phosphate synthase subunit HisH [Alphaproteobacteria bacterium]